MQRRNFLRGLGAGSVALGAGAVSTRTFAKAEHKWKMVTTWPKNFPGLGTTANRVGQLIESMSDGRIRVKVYGAGELVPPFETFDACSRGTVELGHGSAYYWKGKVESAQFFSTVPFGLTAQEMGAWLEFGGGMELWRELYTGFGLVPIAAGNSTVQMAGWFNREINSLADLSGLKMRIPGLGGEVLQRAGGTPVNLPGGELFTALKSGTIDATEWVGPYNDLAFGLHKAAKYYYYPGWHEPGTAMELIVNKAAWDALPDDLKAIVEGACAIANQRMIEEYTARNNAALETLVNEHHVDVRRLPDDVLKKLHALSLEVVAELANKDEFSRRVFASYEKFRKQVMRWSELSDRAYLNARAATAI
ncbi:MAG: TRAP transporter substrate-binding protein DctP [Chromatiales bacterium]|nr:TRAP transporter substrate-binding protein DctP [Chromatiales bacterium]